MQNLLRRVEPTAPEAVKVLHVMQRCHPSFKRYLLGRSFPSLEELARFAQQMAEPPTPAVPIVAEEGVELHGGMAEASW